MKNLLQVLGKPGNEVAEFSMEDLRMFVSDAIRQKISSLVAHFSVNVRFEKM